MKSCLFSKLSFMRNSPLT